MNNKVKQVKIGNENFKCWLKKLDPVSRVERMSAIAKTQAAAGLRGSLIKESLAQLSQRCQVMLFPLSDEDIERYSRRKPAKQPVDIKNSFNKKIATKKVKSSSSKLSKCSFDNTVKEEKFRIKDSTKHAKVKSAENERSTLKPHLPIQEAISTEKCTKCSKVPLGGNEGGRCCVSNPTYTEASTESSKKPLSIKPNPSSNVKLKRKYKELFGDDFDELSVPNNESSRSNNNSENACDKNVNNYLNTTVNVTIVNSSKKTKSKNDKITATANSLVDSNVFSANESSNKRLRIDVSLSNNDSKISNGGATAFDRNHSKDLNTPPKKPHRDRKRKKLAHHKAKQSSESSTNQIKIGQSKTFTSESPLAPLNANSSEEDPSIKELWSILGMESPTDRSKNIKFYPLPSDETVTLHTAPEEIGSNFQTEKNECKNTLENTTNSESRVLMTNNNKCVSESISSDLLEITNKTSEDVSQEVNSMCKISETYSLASEPPTVSESLEIGEILQSIEQRDTYGNETLLAVNLKEKCAQISSSINVENDSDTIETILIPDDDDEEEENTRHLESTDTNKVGKSTQPNQNISEPSKVGTIRVRSLGSLLKSPTVSDSQFISESTINNLSEASTAEGKQLQLSFSESPIQASEEEQYNIPSRKSSCVEERFCITYKYYFSVSVEEKIPKLGELLHLAVADGIRRSERIKRAEQLSSDDLIQEEKQRAEKDFNDMMKIRGQEFTAICDLILKRFDQSSKITLFIALFCRILRHAEEIDPANRNYVLEARLVIYRMLLKYQFKDEDILSCLLSDENEFKDQVQMVNILIDKTSNITRCVFKSNLPSVSSLENRNNTHMPLPSNNHNNAQQIHVIANASHQIKTISRQNPGQVSSQNITNIVETQNINSQRSDISKANMGAPKSQNKPQIQPKIPVTLQSFQPAMILNLPQLPTAVRKSHSVSLNGVQKDLTQTLGQQNLSAMVSKTMANSNNATITITPAIGLNSTASLKSTPSAVVVSVPQSTTKVAKSHTQFSGRLQAVLMGQQNLSTSAPVTTIVNSMNVKSTPAVSFTVIDPLQSTSSAGVAGLPQSTTKSAESRAFVPVTTGSKDHLRAFLTGHKNYCTTTPTKPIINPNNVLNTSAVTLNLSPKPSVIKAVPQKALGNKQVSSNPNLNYIPSDNERCAPQEKTHVIVHRLGTDLEIVNLQNKKNSPQYITHKVTGSSSHMMGSNVKNSTIIARKGDNPNIRLNLAAVGRNMMDNVDLGKMITSSPAPTPVTSSENRQSVLISPQSVTTNLTQQTPTLSILLNSTAQSPVPSSSHCHPFKKRMPISGKMKMLFENKKN